MAMRQALFQEWNLTASTHAARTYFWAPMPWQELAEHQFGVQHWLSGH